MFHHPDGYLVSPPIGNRVHPDLQSWPLVLKGCLQILCIEKRSVLKACAQHCLVAIHHRRSIHWTIGHGHKVWQEGGVWGVGSIHRKVPLVLAHHHDQQLPERVF